jgi:hypothetical protein
VDLLRRRGYAPLAAAFTPWGPKQGNIQSQSNTITPGRTVEYDKDVTATEAAKADGGTEGVRLVTIGELDAHREESPELIGIETRRKDAKCDVPTAVDPCLISDCVSMGHQAKC